MGDIPQGAGAGLTYNFTRILGLEADYGVNKNGLQLKAGSKRHQHIVGFEDPENGKTRFALVALDLPTGLDNDGDKSD